MYAFFAPINHNTFLPPHLMYGKVWTFFFILILPLEAMSENFFFPNFCWGLTLYIFTTFHWFLVVYANILNEKRCRSPLSLICQFYQAMTINWTTSLTFKSIKRRRKEWTKREKLNKNGQRSATDWMMAGQVCHNANFTI